MKYLFIVFTFLLISSVAYSQASEDQNKLVETFINDIKNENFESAYINFDSTISVQFSLQQLKDVWAQIKKQYGELETIDEPKITQMTASTLYIYPLNFKNGGLNAQIAINVFSKITGFFLSMRPESFTYKLPPYADSTKFKEIETTFGDPNFELPATLSLPINTNNAPVVILVHGSGPHDQDESIGPNKPFKDIATGLASNGIAVFRYDKRTKLYATKLRPDSVDLNIETIDDAIYALRFVKELANKYKIDKNKIFILGHSLGASLIPRISQKSDIPKAFISLAGMTRTIDQALIEQTFYLYNIDGVFSDEEKSDFELLKRQLLNVLSPNLNLKTPADSLPMGISPFYWMDFRSLDARKEAQKISKPILVLQGEADYQVTMEDFNGWKEALQSNSNAKLISYPGLNHLFMKIPGEKSNPQEYYQPDKIDAKVINDIIIWIRELK